MKMHHFLFVLVALGWLIPLEGLARQTVRDSVKVTRAVYYYQNQVDIFYNCGAGIYAIWPDVAARVLGRETGYSFYSLVATEGQYVPRGWGRQLSDPGSGIVVPEGFYGHNPQLFSAQSGPGGFGGCGESLAAVEYINSGAQVMLNGAPFRVTDWYAVYSLPSGTPIAEFEWEQIDGLRVAFDASFESGLSREVEIDGKKPVVKYEWDFGDGEKGGGAKPIHRYEEAGSYEVTLTVTDDDDETDSVTYTVEVKGVFLEYRTTVIDSVTVGDTLSVHGMVRNAGTETADTVRIQRHIGFVPSYAEEVQPLFFKNNAKRGEAILASSDTVLTDVAPGQEIRIEQRYAIEQEAYALFDEGWASVWVDWKTALTVGGVDEEGNRAKVVDLCGTFGCEPPRGSIVRVLPPEPSMRYELSLERYTEVGGGAGKQGDEKPSVEVGDSVLVRILVENDGDQLLENIMIPDGPEGITIISDPEDALVYSHAKKAAIGQLPPGKSDTLLYVHEVVHAVQADQKVTVFVGKVEAEAVNAATGAREDFEAIVNSCEVTQKGFDDDPEEEKKKSIACADLSIYRGRITVNSVEDVPLDPTKDPAKDDCDTGEKIDRDGVEEAECTLRAAIQITNAQDDKNLIAFNIPADQGTDGFYVIEVETPLDAVSGTTGIDGATQPGFDPLDPRVVLAGGGTAKEGSGLHLEADGSTVRGLAFNGFMEAGIKVEGSTQILVSNLFGRTTDGALSRESGVGVLLMGGTGSLVGGGEASCLEEAGAEGNVFSGLKDAAIHMTEDTAGNLVRCNRIGVDPNDARTKANKHGVLIEDAPGNLVAYNRVHGNAEIGVHIVGEAARNNQVKQNHIGGFARHEVTGRDTEGQRWGVVIESASFNVIGEPVGSGVQYNHIAGHAEADVLIFSEDPGAPANGNTLHGNAIGTRLDQEIWEGQRAKNGKRGLVISGYASNNIIGWIGSDGPSNMIAGHQQANIAIFTPYATGNDIIQGSIGVAREFLAEGYMDGHDAAVGIQIEGASGTQIGATDDNFFDKGPVVIAQQDDIGIVLDGNTHTKVTLDGDQAVSGLPEGGHGTIIQGVRPLGILPFSSTPPAVRNYGIVARNVRDLTIGPYVEVNETNKAGILLENVHDSFVVGTIFMKGFNRFEPISSGLKLTEGSSNNQIGSIEHRNFFLDQFAGILLLCQNPSATTGRCVGNRIQNNLFGVAYELADVAVAGGVFVGIQVRGAADDTRIGGTDPLEGNTFEDVNSGIYIESDEGIEGTTSVSRPKGTVVEGNRFGSYKELRVYAGAEAIEVGDAFATRIGSTIANPTVGGNTIYNYDTGVLLGVPQKEGKDVSVLGNSIYDMRIIGLARYYDQLLPHIWPGIFSTRVDNGTVYATGRVATVAKPNRALLVQYFSSPTCGGITQGKHFMSQHTVTTNAQGVALLDHAVEIGEGEGLTATATDIQDNSTSIFSLCYTHTVEKDDEKVAVNIGGDEVAMEGVGVIASIEAATGKGATSDTLYVTAYPNAPLGMAFDGQAATSEGGQHIIPAGTAGRYWRLETAQAATDYRLDLCLDASALSETDASEAVVVQRSLFTSGLWTPYATTLETHGGTRYACATDLMPTGDFALGLGRITQVATPTLMAPENGSDVADLVPMLSWAAVDGAQRYHVQVSTTATFSALEMNPTEVLETTLETNLSAPNVPYYWRVRAQGGDGVWGPWSGAWTFTATNTAVDVETAAEVPGEYALLSNYPNPFNPQTTVPFTLPAASEVRLVVYDALGREVSVLVDGVLSAGQHEAVFEAHNLPSGLYLYRMTAGSQTFTRTMMLVK